MQWTPVISYLNLQTKSNDFMLYKPDRIQFAAFFEAEQNFNQST